MNKQIAETKVPDNDFRILSDIELDQTSGGFFWLIPVVVALAIASRQC